jgi:hypothetical protein
MDDLTRDPFCNECRITTTGDCGQHGADQQTKTANAKCLDCGLEYNYYPYHHHGLEVIHTLRDCISSLEQELNDLDSILKYSEAKAIIELKAVITERDAAKTAADKLRTELKNIYSIFKTYVDSMSNYLRQ